MKHIFLKRYLMAGLLIWLPIWITFLVVTFTLELFDGGLQYLPRAYQPDNLLGFHIPGLGVVLTILLFFFTGMLFTNTVGKKLKHWAEALLDQIPLVRTIYRSVKQVIETIAHTQGQSFRSVFLVEYPRKGLWSIAFQTGDSSEVLNKTANADLITVFVPTTPNPTSGFLIMVPRDDAQKLEMSVDEALKMVISLGMVQPGNHTASEQDKIGTENA